MSCVVALLLHGALLAVGPALLAEYLTQRDGQVVQLVERLVVEGHEPLLQVLVHLRLLGVGIQLLQGHHGLTCRQAGDYDRISNADNDHMVQPHSTAQHGTAHSMARRTSGHGNVNNKNCAAIPAAQSTLQLVGVIVPTTTCAWLWVCNMKKIATLQSLSGMLCYVTLWSLVLRQWVSSPGVQTRAPRWCPLGTPCAPAPAAQCRRWTCGPARPRPSGTCRQAWDGHNHDAAN